MICFVYSLKIILYTRFQNLFKLNYPFFVVQVVSLIVHIMLSSNWVFCLTIHPDSKLLHYLFICTANSYCAFLLISALFDTSVPPVSAIYFRLDFMCIRRRTPPYLYSIACAVLFL